MNGERARRSSSLGRRIGVAIFWLMAVYVVGAAARSIIPALFWPEHAPRPVHTAGNDD